MDTTSFPRFELMTLGEATGQYTEDQRTLLALKFSTSLKTLMEVEAAGAAQLLRRSDWRWAPQAMLWLMTRREGISPRLRWTPGHPELDGVFLSSTAWNDVSRHGTRTRLSRMIWPGDPPEGFLDWSGYLQIESFGELIESMKATGQFYVQESATAYQHAQMDGGCFLNAEVDVVEFLARGSKLLVDGEMFDGNDAIMRGFDAEMVSDCVLRRRGKITEVRLGRRLTRYGAQLESIPLPTTFEEAKARLEEGLIVMTKFRADGDFRDAEKFVYEGERKVVDKSDVQAMVIVGAGVSGGKLYYIVKNWWMFKQFILATGEYLCGARSEFFHATGELKVMPAWRRKKGKFSEASACIAGDRFPDERQ
jgi:hypothetical protein